jgi:hypothetical protein
MQKAPFEEAVSGVKHGSSVPKSHLSRGRYGVNKSAIPRGIEIRGTDHKEACAMRLFQCNIMSVSYAIIQRDAFAYGPCSLYVALPSKLRMRRLGQHSMHAETMHAGC